jgi:hypothetical protein
MYLQLDDKLIEVRTCLIKIDTGKCNIIRFFDGEKEIIKIFGRCRDQKVDCDRNITKIRAALINVIDNSYIE